jgi:hypothetical protein
MGCTRRRRKDARSGGRRTARLTETRRPFGEEWVVTAEPGDHEEDAHAEAAEHAAAPRPGPSHSSATVETTTSAMDTARRLSRNGCAARALPGRARVSHAGQPYGSR